MTNQESSSSRPSIIPTMRYRDAAAAIDWLCKAFGFEKHLVVPGANGEIAHAELTLRNGMIMLGSAHDDVFDKLQRPADKRQPVTQSPYIIVPDVDAHYARAKAAGAEIVMDIKDEDYGGRGYSARDPQGQLWNFGSYDPWR
jgi:uncharacterized glyoxalase superfamily protein PhnB